jgi:hypothetical protein
VICPRHLPKAATDALGDLLVVDQAEYLFTLDETDRSRGAVAPSSPVRLPGDHNGPWRYLVMPPVKPAWT